MLIGARYSRELRTHDHVLGRRRPSFLFEAAQRPARCEASGVPPSETESRLTLRKFVQKGRGSRRPSRGSENGAVSRASTLRGDGRMIWERFVEDAPPRRPGRSGTSSLVNVPAWSGSTVSAWRPWRWRCAARFRGGRTCEEQGVSRSRVAPFWAAQTPPQRHVAHPCAAAPDCRSAPFLRET